MDDVKKYDLKYQKLSKFIIEGDVLRDKASEAEIEQQRLLLKLAAAFVAGILLARWLTRKR